MIGRKTICTPEVIKGVSDNIMLGLSNQDSAMAAGIGVSTFYDWLARGDKEIARVSKDGRRKMKENERTFVEFSDAVKRAVPLRKKLLIGRIQKAAQTAHHWQAAAWLLERMHFDEFGKRQRLDVVTWEAQLADKVRSGEVPLEEALAAWPELGEEFFAKVGVDVRSK